VRSDARRILAAPCFGVPPGEIFEPVRHVGQVIVETLKRAGANPTRQSLLAAAESFDHYPVAQLLPGITVSTSKANHHPIRCIKLVATMGGRYSFFGDAICAA